jgi:hypothetical protein
MGLHRQGLGRANTKFEANDTQLWGYRRATSTMNPDPQSGLLTAPFTSTAPSSTGKIGAG